MTEEDKKIIIRNNKKYQLLIQGGFSIQQAIALIKLYEQF